MKNRHSVLANARVFEAIKTTIEQLRKWRVVAGVIMPGHSHWIVSPIGDRELSVGDFSEGLKRVLRKTLGSQPWEWSADVLIAFCVPTRTCTANGFTYRTILCGMLWSKERKIGRII